MVTSLSRVVFSQNQSTWLKIRTATIFTESIISFEIFSEHL